MNLFVSGLLTGFSVAAPIGPVSLICIDHTLARGTVYGFVTGLGASTADTLYGLIAALGLTMVADVSMRYHTPIRMVGGILIILIGLYQFFLNNRGTTAASCQPQGTLKGFALVFTSTLSNPFTVCFFLSVFSAFAGGSAAGHDYRRAFAYAGGIFAGTALWWLFLSFCVGFFKKALSDSTLVLIRKFAALLIVAIGAYALMR
jgi:threonine/homoserine/homoserine lactone efflux protein